MAGASRHLEALVLARHEQGESYWRYQLLSPEAGGVEALWRRSTRPRQLTPPDLFEELEATLEGSARGKALFFREHRVLVHRTALASHYASLREAGLFTRTLWRNLAHAEQFAPLYQLCRDALDAFARGRRPELVHFKALYRFAREEGYPVKEEWWANLPAESQPIVVAMLQQPVEAATVGEDPARAQLAALRRYLKAFTEILLAE
jgi:hypothetical protein